MDHQKDDEKAWRSAMRLRYVEIDPDIVAELLDCSQAQIERESEKRLRDLGITRQTGECCLLAWVRTMFAENGCEDSPENRRLLIEAIRDDWKVQLFVWALGGEERKAFGVEDSPAFQEYVVRRHAARSLAPGCFSDHDDPRYLDYLPPPGQSGGTGQRGPNRHIAQSVHGFLVVAVGAWAANGLMARVGWRPVDFLVLLVWIALVAGLLLGLAAIVAPERSDALQRLAFWLAIPAALTAIGLHLNASRKLEADAAQRERWVLPATADEQSVEEVGYIDRIKHLDRLWEHRREIYWFVKIAATHKVYSCSWESGFAGFAKSDAVKLIHRKSDIETADYSGFIIELRGDQAGRSARVWALDIDDLQKLDINER